MLKNIGLSPEHGFCIDESDTEKKAVRLATGKSPYILILMDGQLKDGGSGAYAVKSIRSEGVKTPILMVSNSSSSRQGGLDYGADGAIEKIEIFKSPECLLDHLKQLGIIFAE